DRAELQNDLFIRQSKIGPHGLHIHRRVEVPIVEVFGAAVGNEKIRVPHHAVDVGIHIEESRRRRCYGPACRFRAELDGRWGKSRRQSDWRKRPASCRRCREDRLRYAGKSFPTPRRQSAESRRQTVYLGRKRPPASALPPTARDPLARRGFSAIPLPPTRRG